MKWKAILKHHPRCGILGTPEAFNKEVTLTGIEYHPFQGILYRVDEYGVYLEKNRFTKIQKEKNNNRTED